MNKAKPKKDEISSIRKTVYYLIVFAIVAIIIYKLYYASYLGLLLQWGLAILVIILSGIIIEKVDHLGGNYGVYLLRTKKGINLIEYLSRINPRFWELFAAWGMILGFGVLSYPILRKSVSKRFYAFSLISLMVIMLFIIPYMSYATTFISLPQLESRVSFINSVSPPGINALLFDITHESPILMLMDIITFSTGFAGYVLSSIIYNAGDILFLVIKSIEVSSVKPLSTGIPGVAPVIPGIDLPLLAGLVSLAILLVVHEFSHGILASLSKVKLNSVGLLMIGIIPMGAFVEPDEKEVMKLNKLKQNKISIAGVSMNFLFMIIFFIPMMLMLPYVVSHIYHTNVVIEGTIKGFPAYNVIKPGTYLYAWNGDKVSNLTGLENIASHTKPNETVTISTSSGNYTFTAKRYNKTTSLIGISVGEVTKPITNTLTKGFAFFFYTVFALSFMLNFLIGAVNLLPLPGFDGWRVYSTSIKDKRVVSFIILVIIIALVINVLPWFG